MRDGIVHELIDWQEAAGTIASDEGTPGIMAGFHIPHGAKTEDFSAKVTAICDHAETLKQKFLDLNFDDDFIDQMRLRVEAFGQAIDDKSTGLEGQVGAHGGLSATIREGVLAGRQLNVMMKQLYKDDPEKLAAWKTAFHTERVGKSGKSKKKDSPEKKP